MMRHNYSIDRFCICCGYTLEEYEVRLCLSCLEAETIDNQEEEFDEDEE